VNQKILIPVKMRDLDSESGNNLVFKIPLKQLILVLIRSVHKIAQDFKHPLRMYATSAFSVLTLFASVLDEDVEEPERVGKKTLKEGEKERVLGDWHKTWRGEGKTGPLKVVKSRKKRVTGKRPPDAQLLEFRNNGALNKDIAKVLGVCNSTVGLWFKNIK